MTEPYVLRLEGPGKNALSSKLMERILAGLDEAAGRPVLVVGAGDAFSAGLDLREVASLDAPRMRTFLGLLERCMTALYLYPGPTVAALNGHAIAGGCVVTLCCDHRLVLDGPRLRVGLNEVALGVRFPPRIMAIVKQRVPLRHLSEVVLGAGLFAPAEAVRLGLVDEVVPAVEGGVEAMARKRLEALGRHPAKGYALAKLDLRGTAESLCPGEVHGPALTEACALWTSAEVKERLAAVLAR